MSGGKGWKEGNAREGGGEGEGGSPVGPSLFPYSLTTCHSPHLYEIYKATGKNWKLRIVVLHRIKRRRLLSTVNEMIAAHKNSVVIDDIQQKNKSLVVLRL